MNQWKGLKVKQGPKFCFVLTAVSIFSGFTLLALAAGQQQSTQQALQVLQSQAEKGDLPAQFKLGLEYISGQKVPISYRDAAKWFRMAADQGSAPAQYDLGVLYYNGHGVPRNYAEARKWYDKAARQGNALAQFNLGLMYYKGRGVAQNYQRAARWYRKSADQGNADAQYNLGILYYTAEGVPQDDIKAYEWSDLAASNSTGKLRRLALENREVAARYLTSKEIAQAQRLVAAWQSKKSRKNSLALLLKEPKAQPKIN